MILKLNDLQVEVELDRNLDGSRFIATGYYIDDKFTDLTDAEMDYLQRVYDDKINADWRG